MDKKAEKNQEELEALFGKIEEKPLSEFSLDNLDQNKSLPGDFVNDFDMSAY